MSKIKLPNDNGPYREGKGTLYEGGTRVISVANWPGHIKAGSVVNEMIHTVDMYPTLLNVAGASTAKAKPLDGLDVWGTISDGSPAAHGDHLQYRALPGRRPRGRLEAHLAHAPAAGGRTLQYR